MKTQNKYILPLFGAATALGITYWLKNRKSNQNIQVTASNIYAFAKTVNNSGISFSADFVFKNSSSKAVILTLDTVNVLVKGIAKANKITAKTFTVQPNASVKVKVGFVLEYKNMLSGTSNVFTQTLTALQKTFTQTIEQLKTATFRVQISSAGDTKTIDIKQSSATSVEFSALSGLALSAGKRTITDGSGFNQLIQLSGNFDNLVNPNASVDSVVEICHDIVHKFHPQVRKLADYLWQRAKGDAYLFGKELFAFCYSYIQYENDNRGLEQLRTPSRTWSDRAKGVDCDDFSIFCASVLTCKGIPYKFRITKYNGKQNYQHIYCVAIINGKEVAIDPVIDRYDYEKPYSEKKDFNPKNL